LEAGGPISPKLEPGTACMLWLENCVEVGVFFIRELFVGEGTDWICDTVASVY
jgi:hypothetical protein